MPPILNLQTLRSQQEAFGSFAFTQADCSIQLLNGLFKVMATATDDHRTDEMITPVLIVGQQDAFVNCRKRLTPLEEVTVHNALVVQQCCFCVGRAGGGRLKGYLQVILHFE
jgi:hypothetical protein